MYLSVTLTLQSGHFLFVVVLLVMEHTLEQSDLFLLRHYPQLQL